MDEMDGLEVLAAVKAQAPDTDVMLMTAYGTIEIAVEAMKRGAIDFITKPFPHDELRMKIEKVLDYRAARRDSVRLGEQNRYLRDEIDGRYNFGEIIGQSVQMYAVLGAVRKVAATESSVLIYGESGTGKELLAQAIHENSSRRDGPLVRVHCAALSTSLLESELFGHVKGAFTGAHRDRVGRFELANGGTLFLDEIGDISLETQIKLLRVLQTRSFEPVGGARTIEVDVRLITATHQDLKALINANRFREDLFYRLNVISIELPGLSERKEDIVELAVHFLKRSSSRLNKTITNINESAVSAMLNYDWPGNIRELENAIERAAVLTDDETIGIEDLPDDVRAQGPESRPVVLAGRVSQTDAASDNAPPVRAESGNERDWLLDALRDSGGNKARAARSLGLPRSTFFSKLKKHGLD